jgi:hypothetical protein
MKFVTGPDQPPCSLSVTFCIPNEIMSDISCLLEKLPNEQFHPWCYFFPHWLRLAAWKWQAKEILNHLMDLYHDAVISFCSEKRLTDWVQFSFYWRLGVTSLHNRNRKIRLMEWIVCIPWGQVRRGTRWVHRSALPLYGRTSQAKIYWKGKDET